MALILDMLKNRLPDETALFAASLAVTIEEAQAQAGFEGIPETDLSTTRKSLIADLAAKALLIPARSHYKKAMAEVEGDDAGKAKFNDKLAFLNQMEAALTRSIEERRKVVSSVDTGVPMMVVGND